LDNKLVRQGLSYAADRKRFAETALLGVSRPQSLPWDPKSPAFEPQKEVPFDPEKATSMLRQAGLEDAELDMLVYPGYLETRQFEDMYQADLGKIGIQPNIKSLDAAALFGMVAARPPAYQGMAELSGTVYATPISLLSSNGFYIPDSNAAGYKNDAYTQLVNQIFTEPDDATRKERYSRLNDLIVDDAWTWSIATIPIRIAATAKLRDIGIQAHDSFQYWDAWLESWRLLSRGQRLAIWTNVGNNTPLGN
jgi:ABC-type transport system substrate-binding protein